MSENTITIKTPCLNCGDDTETKIHSIDKDSIMWICSKCSVMCSVPRDNVYLARFEPIGLIKDVPPAASITITPSFNNPNNYK